MISLTDVQREIILVFDDKHNYGNKIRLKIGRTISHVYKVIRRLEYNGILKKLECRDRKTFYELTERGKKIKRKLLENDKRVAK